MQPGGSRARVRSLRWTAPLLGLVLGGAAVVHASVAPGAVADWSYAVATLAAAVLGGAGLVGAEPIARRAWAPAVAGLALSCTGDLLYAALASAGSAPSTSIADVGWLLCYPALALTLFRLLKPTDGRRRAVADLLIDIGVVAVIGLAVVWQVSVGSTLRDGSTPVLDRVVASAYPVCDAVLLALVLRLLATRLGRRGAGSLLAAGVGCWLVADFSSLVGAGSTQLLDAGWIVGAVLIAGAVLDGVRRSTTAPDAPVEVGAGGIALVLLPLGLPIVAGLVQYLTGWDVDPVVLLLASAALLGLAFARGLLVLAALREGQERLRSSERYHQAVAANASDAFVLLDADGRVVAGSPNLDALVGRHGVDGRGAPFETLVELVEPELTMAQLQRARALPGEPIENLVPIVAQDGTERVLAARVVDLLAHPDVRGILVNLHDVTDQQRAEEELAHRAFHDGLTGLANRALFFDRVGHALHTSARTGRGPAVLFLDVDAFKSVNDTLGHDGGDQVLQEVAARLRRAVRSGDTVSRLGGDEFAVLVERTGAGGDVGDEVVATAERLLEALRRPFVVDGRSFSASASIGIAEGGPGDDPAALVRNADIAMYRAKGAGKGRWVRFAPEMAAAALHRVAIEAGLHDAVALGQLELHYQPVLDLQTERLVGFEALVRWHHPTLGLVTPDQFIPVAEETGLIEPIGGWVLDEACRQLATWCAGAPSGPPISMAINLSMRQLARPSIIDDVVEALDGSGAVPEDVVLEVTETAIMEDLETAAERLRALKALGVRIAIDDFGTGYSSLRHLQQLPIDIVKIDRSFVATIDDPEHNPALVRGMLELGRVLGLEVIAEGIEHAAQRDWLRRERCPMGQGFLFSKPVTATLATELLRREQAPSPTP